MKRLLFVIVCVLSSMVVSAQTISAKEKAVVRQQFINFCKDMNQQLPAQVDEITTLNSIAFINWTMTSTYTVDIDASDVSAEDMALFKSCMHDAFPDFDYASPILDFSIFRGQNRHFCPRLVSFEHQTRA